MGDAGHELDLLVRQPLRPLGGDEHHAGRGSQQRQDAEADPQVAPADGRHRLFEGAVAVLDHQLPGSGLAMVLRRRRGGMRAAVMAAGHLGGSAPVVSASQAGLGGELAQLLEGPQPEHPDLEVTGAEGRCRRARSARPDSASTEVSIQIEPLRVIPSFSIYLTSRDGRL